jgi:hypothetical protein
VSAAVTSGRLWLAGRAVLALQENGALRDAELREILDCTPEDLQAAIPVMVRWRKADRCAGYLVAVPPRRKGRRSALEQ